MLDSGHVQIGEHYFKLPPLPPKNEIINYNLPKKEQYWRRQKDFPDFFFAWNSNVELEADYTRGQGKRLVSLNKKDTGHEEDFENGKTGSLYYFREREIYRRKHGVWFMNNGEPTYLTGNHYFSLQWGAMANVDNLVEPGSNYGMYLQFQRDFFYFFELCKTTNYARGGMVVKPKKTGVTQLMALACLNEGTLTRQKLIRIMSTSQKVANKSCFKYLDFALQNMPTIITPSISNWNTFEVVFGMPEKKNSKAATKLRETNMEFFDTTISTVPTNNASFDSLTNYIAWVDEFTKIITEANPKGLHEVTVDTVVQGFSRKGTIIYTNYTQEENDTSFEEGRQIYKDSGLNTVDQATGMTKSKLIRYTMLTQHGLFGDIKDGVMQGIDMYGKPNLNDIYAKVNQELEQIKNSPYKIQGYKRRYPMSEADPWMEAGGENQMFDVVRIANQLQQLEQDEALGDIPFSFNLKFEKAPKKKNELTTECAFEGKILMEPLSDADRVAGRGAKFMWYDKQWTPDDFLQKHINNIVVDRNNKLLKPRLDTPFFATLDPTNYSLKKEIVVSSKNALQVFILPDEQLNGYFGENVTNKRLMAEYLYRHDKPHDTLMDAIMVVLYFGCYILIESNMAWIATRMIEMGLGNFVLMVSEETGILEPYSKTKKQKYFTSQGATIGKYFLSGVHHLKEPDMDGEIDNIKYIKSFNVLKQLLRISPEDTTKYDAAVCYLEGIWGIDWYYGWRQKEREKQRFAGDKDMKGIMGFMR